MSGAIGQGGIVSAPSDLLGGAPGPAAEVRVAACIGVIPYKSCYVRSLGSARMLLSLSLPGYELGSRLPWKHERDGQIPDVGQAGRWAACKGSA